MYNKVGDFMYSIENNVSDYLVIKKSKFICYIYKVDNEDSIKSILNDIKDKYSDSTHICYAYILGNKIKYNDDKEPNKTAGFQILNILQNNNLTNVLGIVIRYYGGIKLGVGPLSKAYKDVTKLTLDKTNIIEYKEYIYLQIKTDYENIKKLDYLLKDIEIVEKDFNDSIMYKIKVCKSKEENIKKVLNEFDIT